MSKTKKRIVKPLTINPKSQIKYLIKRPSTSPSRSHIIGTKSLGHKFKAQKKKNIHLKHQNKRLKRRVDHLEKKISSLITNQENFNLIFDNNDQINMEPLQELLLSLLDQTQKDHDLIFKQTQELHQMKTKYQKVQKDYSKSVHTVSKQKQKIKKSNTKQLKNKNKIEQIVLKNDQFKKEIDNLREQLSEMAIQQDQMKIQNCQEQIDQLIEERGVLANQCSALTEQNQILRNKLLSSQTKTRYSIDMFSEDESSFTSSCYTSPTVSASSPPSSPFTSSPLSSGFSPPRNQGSKLSTPIPLNSLKSVCSSSSPSNSTPLRMKTQQNIHKKKYINNKYLKSTQRVLFTQNTKTPIAKMKKLTFKKQNQSICTSRNHLPKNQEYCSSNIANNLANLLKSKQKVEIDHKISIQNEKENLKPKMPLNSQKNTNLSPPLKKRHKKKQTSTRKGSSILKKKNSKYNLLKDHEENLQFEIMRPTEEQTHPLSKVSTKFGQLENELNLFQRGKKPMKSKTRKKMIKKDLCKRSSPMPKNALKDQNSLKNRQIYSSSNLKSQTNCFIIENTTSKEANKKLFASKQGEVMRIKAKFIGHSDCDQNHQNLLNKNAKLTKKNRILEINRNSLLEFRQNSSKPLREFEIRKICLTRINKNQKKIPLQKFDLENCFMITGNNLFKIYSTKNLVELDLFIDYFQQLSTNFKK
ncbi:structural maintenance of chromosomes protein [Anaeramoeba flamelloides]|uniref:Structural maintenance of chromosomes protein n=1 Tax=Anaeramoeba flamelloides TaxID=1746091 RepID=A0AAV8A3H6_9EUKA|nr:structural maintenance of chromosomes protein [Anaeramoeba flamelloides]